MTESKITSAKQLLATGVPPRDVAQNLGVSVNGKPAKIPAASNPRDVFLGEWFTQMKDVREGILEGTEGQNTAGPLQIADWVQSLRCVIESARLRRGTVPGSRHYLDFLGPFIEQATRR